jgi:hypothetical protein
MRLSANFRQTFGDHDATSASFRQTFGDHDATFSQLSGTKQQNCSCSMKSLLPSSLINLSSLYQQIRDQAIQTPHWPASQTISQAFECGNNVYHAPSFEDGNGPVALVALFSESENPSALPLIQNCLSQFDQFIQDLSAVATNSHTREDQSRNTEPNPKSILHLIDAKVPHICILVFQEHPSLLTPEQHIHWRSVDEATVDALYNDLSSKVFHNVTSSIGLQLDSILLTPDGAMIAGFIPMDAIALSTYQFIQTESSTVARNLLQTELTSRPKQLIHVTLGRILGFQESARINDSAQIQDLVRQYNLEVLPAFVAKCQMTNQHIWHLQDITLLRNNVWLCEENTIYRVWDLDRPAFSADATGCES